MTRRSLLGSAGALTSLSALPACSRSTGRSLTYWSHNYPSMTALIRDVMIPGFAAEGGLAVDYASFEINELNLKVLTGWMGGTGGPDLVSTGDQDLLGYVRRHLVSPVEPAAFGFTSQQALIESYEPGSLDGFIVDGTLYGIPMDSAAVSLYYRKDIFRECGLDPDRPPATWEEVAEHGRQLVKRDRNGNITRAGWSWEASSLSSHFYYWGALLPQKGVDFLSPDGRSNGFHNDAGLSAFRYVYDAFNTYRISALGLAPTVSPIDDFGTGRVAMINSGLWLAPALEAQYPGVTFKDGIYGIARLPQFRNGTAATRLNSWVWMVAAHSPVKQQAWHFVSYMTQLPRNRAAWIDRVQFVQPWKGLSQSAAMTAIPYAGIFLADSQIGRPPPRTVRFNRLANAVARIYDQISADGDAPEIVVPKLARQVDRILQT